MNYNFKELSNDLIKNFKNEFEFGIFEFDQSVTIDELDSSNLFEFGNRVQYKYCDKVIALVEVFIFNETLQFEELFEFFDDISEDAYEIFINAICKNSFHKELIETQKFAYIEHVEVHPELRGIGLGKEILMATERFLSLLGVKAIYMVSGALTKDDCSPQGFYEKLGYELLNYNKESDCQSLYKRLYTEPSWRNIFRVQPPQAYIEDCFFSIPTNLTEALDCFAIYSNNRLILNKDKIIIISGYDFTYDEEYEGSKGLLKALKKFKHFFSDIINDIDSYAKNQKEQSGLAKEIEKHIKSIDDYITLIELFIENNSSLYQTSTNCFSYFEQR